MKLGLGCFLAAIITLFSTLILHPKTQWLFFGGFFVTIVLSGLSLYFVLSAAIKKDQNNGASSSIEKMLLKHFFSEDCFYSGIPSFVIIAMFLFLIPCIINDLLLLTIILLISISMLLLWLYTKKALPAIIRYKKHNDCGKKGVSTICLLLSKDSFIGLAAILLSFCFMFLAVVEWLIKPI